MNTKKNIHISIVIILVLSIFLPILQSGHTPQLVAAASLHETAQGSVAKDTYAQSGWPDTPPGNQKYLYLGYNTTYSKYKTRLFVQFNLPSLPAYAVVDSVYLQLRYCYSPATSAFGVTAYQVNSSWEEYGVTWNDQPAIGSAVGNGTIAISYSYQSIDITTLGRAWYSGTPNYGVALFANNELALGGAFYSRDDSVNLPPKLVINYHVEAAPNNPPTAQDGSFTTAEDTPIEVKLQASDPDGNALKYDIVSNPTNGSLSGDAPNLIYTPNADYNGTDAFTFKVNDGQLDSNTATISINVTPVDDVVRKPWTFMLYFAGDNNLEYVLRQAKEKLEALPSNPNVNLVVLIDGYAYQDTFRYLIQPGGVYSNENKWHLTELDMGSATTLQEFVTWSMDTYPADHYYLAIANHGGGTYGVSSDDTSDTLITPLALGNALRNATYNGERKIDVVHFDACLMAMMEIFYEISPYTDYIVASENLGWGVFAFDRYQNLGVNGSVEPPYEYDVVVQDVGVSTTPQQLADRITEAYFNHSALTQMPRTITSVSSSGTLAVNTAVNNLADALIAGLDDPATKDAISLARINVQKLDSENYGSLDVNERFIDLYDFADQLAIGVSNTAIRDAAQAVKGSITQWKTSEYHASGRMTYNQETNYIELGKAYGVSIFFPPRPNNYDYANYVGHNLFLFTTNNNWDEFLKKYMGVLALPPDNSPPPSLPWIMDPLSNKLYLPTVAR